MLCVIQTFELDILIASLKKYLIISLLIRDLYFDNLYVYLYNKLSKANLPIVPFAILHPNIKLSFIEITPELNLQACNIFIANAIENKPANMAIIVIEKRAMTSDFIYIITKLIQYIEFTPYKYYLDSLHLLPLLAEITDTIGKQYNRFLLGAKAKFYVDQMRVEVACICLLVRQKCY